MDGISGDEWGEDEKLGRGRDCIRRGEYDGWDGRVVFRLYLDRGLEDGTKVQWPWPLDHRYRVCQQELINKVSSRVQIPICRSWLTDIEIVEDYLSNLVNRLRRLIGIVVANGRLGPYIRLISM